MKGLTREQRAYALENGLVILMIGSTIALQIRRRKYAKGEGPLLLRALDSVSGEVMPWPVELFDRLLGRADSTREGE